MYGMMRDDHWQDLPDGFDGAHVNQETGTSFRDNHEVVTPSSSNNPMRLSGPYIQEDGRFHVSDSNAGKKKKASRIIGWGLRRFSTIVCRKVQSKGRTTYNEVADEIITEMTAGTCPGEQFDEKNIRRRVYDAFNVLIAINVIAKDRKEIRWIGFPITKSEQEKHLEELHMNLRSRTQAKTDYLKELEHQFVDLQKLVLQNKQLYESRMVSSDGVHLPFLLVRTSPKATVEIEISEDTRTVHFDFNETPYSLYDHRAILKMMRCPKVIEPEQALRSPLQERLITDQSGRILRPSSFSWHS